jgi:AcrR family transcriptional regulator
MAVSTRKTVSAPAGAESFPSPKVGLILAAETLFGSFGVEGVSLRRVSEQAGNRNVYAAQYHFGSKENLLEAVLLYRRPMIDNHRRLLLLDWRTTAQDASLHQIVRLLCSGMFEQDSHDPAQARSFSRFLRSLLQFEAYVPIWTRSIAAAPLTAELLATLRDHLPHLPPDIFALRRLALGKLMVGAIADYDRDAVIGRVSQEIFLDDLINMIAAGYLAPANSSRS